MAVEVGDAAPDFVHKDGVVRHRVIGDVGTARDQDEYIQALAACPI